MPDERPINFTVEQWQFPEPPFVRNSGRGALNLLQRYQPLGLSDLLVFAAWAHGIRAGDRLHRLPLFAYLHSHLTPYMGLQGCIEKSNPHFRNVEKGSGVYEFTPTGYERALRLFGEPRARFDADVPYTFMRCHEDLRVSVLVMPTAISVQINGEDVAGTVANERLAAVGIHRPKSGSQPETIWNWIVGLPASGDTQTTEFAWARG